MTGLLTFNRLKWGSFIHSAVYTVLLVVWLVPGLAGLEMVFGMAHGLGWIAMSLACLVGAAPARHRPAPRRRGRRARRDRPVHRLLRVLAPEPSRRRALRRVSRAHARLTPAAQPAASSSTATLTARVMSAP